MSTDIGPLVSILMPVFRNPHYFQLALKSALLQTYPNIEIIIYDNTGANEVKQLVEKEFLPYSSKIAYKKFQKPLPRLQVFRQLLNDAKGEYVNYLLEEDLFYPTKIQRMLAYFLNDFVGEVKLVTSYRQPIDVNGNVIPDLTSTARRHHQDTVIDGFAFGDSMMVESNWVGEATTVMFRKKDLTEPFGQFGGYDFRSAYDMATWLNLFSKGKGVYIKDPLSFVRIYPERNDFRTRMDAVKDWMHLISYSPKKGFLQNLVFLQRYKISLLDFINSIYSDETNPPNQDDIRFLNECKERLDCL